MWQHLKCCGMQHPQQPFAETSARSNCFLGTKQLLPRHEATAASARSDCCLGTKRLLPRHVIQTIRCKKKASCRHGMRLFEHRICNMRLCIWALICSRSMPARAVRSEYRPRNMQKNMQFVFHRCIGVLWFTECKANAFRVNMQQPAAFYSRDVLSLRPRDKVPSVLSPLQGFYVTP